MIEVQKETLTIVLDRKGSELLTSGLSCLIEWKKKNKCEKLNCNDCLEQGNNMREPDIEKLAKDILDIYFEMYKISMSKTKIPTLQEIKDKITN